jgi:hypothetical protein
VAARNRDLSAAFREWMEPLVRSGEVRPTSTPVLAAIVSGPVHAIARRWLAGHLHSPLIAFADELAEAAWAALRGTGVPAPAALPAPAELPCRVTLELVSDGGAAVARGQATVRLA